MESFVYHMGSQVWAAGGAFAVAILLWLIIRRKRERIWFPLLRIMKHGKKTSPRFRIVKPPLLPFICFLILGTILRAYSFKPSVIAMKATEPRQSTAHIFFDMSPSVTAHIDEEKYYDLAQQLWKELSGFGRVTASTSHRKDIVELGSSVELVQILRARGFHRPGLRLGNAIKEQLSQISSLDRLYIVSDNDRLSWDDFNWKFLNEKIQVYLVPVNDPQKREILPNVYIAAVKGTAAMSSTMLQWQIDLVRTRTDTPQNGKIMLSWGNIQLTENPWSFAKNQKSISIDITVPQTDMAKYKEAISPEEPLKWEIFVDGKDAVAADNRFLSYVRWTKQDAMLIAEPRGELLLTGNLHHLETSLSLLGFHPLRLDRFPQNTKNLGQYPLWILFGGDDGEVDGFCPGAPEETDPLQHYEARNIWLVPSYPDMEYDNLCRCLIKLVGPSAGQSNTVCDHLGTRDKWVGLLSSLPSKRLLGDIENVLEAPAFSLENKKTKTKIVAFTIPMTPGIRGGLTYAGLPVIVKTLMEHLGLLQGDTSTTGDEWPRVRDISSLYDKEPEELSRITAISNVPTAESSLATLDPTEMPPIWQHDAISQDGAKVKGKKSSESLHIIKNFLIVCFIIVLIESLMILLSRIPRRRLRDNAGHLLIILALWGGTEARGSVSLALVGNFDSHLQYDRISREVVARTSIDYSQHYEIFKSISDQALASPWLWSRGIDQLVDSQGVLKESLQTWLKRGGFLVIEGSLDEALLQNLTRRFQLNHDVDGWRAIPPDHEMMRSFHLLDALPVCDGHVFRGFHFDGRLAVLVIPYHFLDSVADNGKKPSCVASLSFEHAVRVYINILMVALTTDYKNDQVHLPEILKRLR